MMTILGGWASVLLILLPGTAPAYAEPLLTPQPVEARQLSEYFTPNYFINRSRHLWPKAQWSNTLTRFSLLNTEHVKFLDACQKHTAILVSEDYSDYSTAKNPHFNELYILDQQQNIINKYKTRIKDPSYFRAQYSPNCEKMLIWTRGFPPSIFNFKAHKITSQFPNPELQGTASFFFFSESQVLYQVFNEKDHLNSLYVLDTKNSQKTPKPIYSDKKYFRLMTDPDSKGIALIEDNSGLRRLYLNGEMEIIASKKEKTPRKLVYLGNNIWAETLSQPLTGENSIQLFLQNNESVRISGFDPIRVDSRYFVYSSLAGSNEVILNLFDLRDRVSRKLTSATRIGLSLPHITHGQIYAEFNANFERETLLNYDINGVERVLFRFGYKPQEVTVEPHLVESSDNFKYPAYKYSMPTRPARGVIVFVQGGGCHVDTP
ncbi:MAG: hypothetical protein ACXVB1_18965, partial [Pseudobdellovibrionaceae bacterium]